MTIYKGKLIEKKDDETDIPLPEVVDSPLMELTFQQDEKKKGLSAGLPPAYLPYYTRQRRSNFTNICLLSTALLVLGTGVIGGIYLYRHLTQHRFIGRCGVRFYEYTAGGRQRLVGHFEEQVELDRAHGRYEKIQVPAFENSKKASILHDFEMNVTAIVDSDLARCFVMPLNRTLVKPPTDFWDLIGKLKSGYYMPDSEAVREHYHVLQPPIHNLAPFGFYIMNECQYFDTFRLQKVWLPVKMHPIGIVKRETSTTFEYTVYSGSSPVIIDIEG